MSSFIQLGVGIWLKIPVLLHFHTSRAQSFVVKTLFEIWLRVYVSEDACVAIQCGWWGGNFLFRWIWWFIWGGNFWGAKNKARRYMLKVAQNNTFAGGESRWNSQRSSVACCSLGRSTVKHPVCNWVQVLFQFVSLFSKFHCLVIFDSRFGDLSQLLGGPTHSHDRLSST